MNTFAKYAIAIIGILAVGFALGWWAKKCPPATFDEEDLRRAQQENDQLREQYAFDSTYTKMLEHALDSLQKAHDKTPVQERASNALKTTHNAHADSLLKWHLRPIGSALGTPE